MRLLNVLVSNLVISQTGPKLLSDDFTCCHTETAREDHDFCLNWSHYTDTDLTSKKRVSGAAIESTTSWPAIARFTN